jgi:hypothetical protein
MRSRTLGGTSAPYDALGRAENVQRWIRRRSGLPGASEDVVSLSEKVTVWFQQRAVRGPDPSSLEALKAMDEHRAVDLIKDISSNVDRQVRRDTENVRVERRVVELAERKPIANGRFALWMAVRQDVSGFEQLRMLQVAHGTTSPIRLEHAFSEPLLMQSSLDDGADIAASCIDRGRIVKLKGRRRNDLVIDNDRERQAGSDRRRRHRRARPVHRVPGRCREIR